MGCWNSGMMYKKKEVPMQSKEVPTQSIGTRIKNKTPFKPNIPLFQHSTLPIGAKPLSSVPCLS